LRHFLHSFRAIWISATIIALIELSCWIFARPQQLAASNFLELAYLKKENTSKVYIQARTQLTLGLHPAIVQVGDSSGMHGVMPVVLDKYLDGLRYVNDGFAGDVGYFGHFDVAKTVLNHSNSVKAVVFYVTPLAKPAISTKMAPTHGRIPTANPVRKICRAIHVEPSRDSAFAHLDLPRCFARFVPR